MVLELVLFVEVSNMNRCFRSVAGLGVRNSLSVKATGLNRIFIFDFNGDDVNIDVCSISVGLVCVRNQ